MTDNRFPSQISRRSILAFLGAGAAERALAQHPLLSTAPAETPFLREQTSQTPQDSNIKIGPTHEVRYTSGGVSYVENLDQGRWVGRYLSANGDVQSHSELPAQNAFTVVIKDRPSPAQQQGMSLSSGWDWVSASEVAHRDGSSRHGVVVLSHSKMPITVEVHTLLDGTPVMTRSLTLTNKSDKPLALTELSPWSGRLWSGPDPVSMGVSAQWQVRWEGWFDWKHLQDGMNSVREDKGLVWDDPYFVLHNETAGEYAFGQLAWPANYFIELNKERGVSFRVGPTAAEVLRVIAPGETITTPALHLGCVKGDFDAAVQSMHDHIRSSVLPAEEAARSHLIQYLIPEDWPMTVYRGDQYNEANMKKCIDVAAAVGIEMFVLDGPMWCSAYGDWSVPNKERFPQGLLPLVEYSHSKGVLFGLYSETEGGRDGYCSKPDGACIGSWNTSQVFQEHPKWFVQPNSILNLSIPEAATYMKSAVSGIIDQYQLDMFRHDFNAPQRGHGSQTERSGFVEDDYWRHYDAFYEIFRTVRQRYPHLILQQAAAGGARSELATIGVFHEQFTSDRATMPFVYRMLSGYSVFLPPETLVNSNGMAVPKDRPDLDTMLRGSFALGNTPMIFNAILPKSVDELTPQVREKYLHYANLYKNFMRPLLSVCKVYHHAPVNAEGGVDSGDWFAMEFISPDREKGWATIIRLSEQVTEPYLFKPRGLDASRKYRVKFDSSGVEEVHVAADLARHGSPVKLAAASASELLLFQIA
jgi:alpha-galactosidase